MSFSGPPPAMPPPSGPFEASLTKIASSPYSLAVAIFLINLGGRFLPMEISKEQEKFLNQPWFRRIIIFVIFFLATRNIITAAWMALIVILCVGYLFNENSSLCILGKGGINNATCKTKGAAQTLGLTQEETAILKSLQDKASKLEVKQEPAEVNTKFGLKSHDQYSKVMRGLWGQ
uniref:Uncharacterized protein n=1 Tax=viral metagenome TaxID=1070528 RepID=A0A6C0AN72_9ZZZZ